MLLPAPPGGAPLRRGPRLLRHLGLGALLAVAGTVAPLPALHPAALAASLPVPVYLPASQAPDDWTALLAARGLSLAKGVPPAGASVVIVDRKDYWEMTVRDRKGGVQTVNVAPCLTPGEREDLLFYVATLLGPTDEPVVAEAPPPGVVSPPVAVSTPPSTPVAVGTPPPTSTPVAVGAPASNTSGATPSTSPPATSTAAKPTTTASKPPPAAGASAGAVPVEVSKPSAGGDTGPWLGGGLGVGFREAAGVVGDFRVDGGWHLTPSVRVGVGLAGRTNAALVEMGEGRAMTDFDVVAEGAWIAPMRIAPVAGLYAGVASRSFREDGAAVIGAAVPILGGELGVQIPLGALPIHLEPSLRVQGDLRAVELQSEVGTALLAPVEVRAGLVVGWRPR